MSLRRCLGRQANANARFDLALLVICLASDIFFIGCLLLRLVDDWDGGLFDFAPVSAAEWPE